LAVGGSVEEDEELAALKGPHKVGRCDDSDALISPKVEVVVVARDNGRTSSFHCYREKEIVAQIFGDDLYLT